MFEGDGIAGDVKSIESSIKLADISLTAFARKLKDSIIDVGSLIERAAAIQTKSANTVRESLGQTRAVRFKKLWLSQLKVLCKLVLVLKKILNYLPR